MLAGESPVLELSGHQVARSTAGGVIPLSEVALEGEGVGPLSTQNRGPQEHEPKKAPNWSVPLLEEGVGMPSPSALGEGCYDTAIHRKHGCGELKAPGPAARVLLPEDGSVRSHLQTSRTGSPAWLGWHVVKVSWSKAGGPCISGDTPIGKSVLKGRTGGADDGCMGVGGDHSTDDGEDRITLPEERVPALTTSVEWRKTSICPEVVDA